MTGGCWISRHPAALCLAGLLAGLADELGGLCSAEHHTVVCFFLAAASTRLYRLAQDRLY